MIKLADDSHEISCFIFFRKVEKMSQNLSSAAVVFGALRVKMFAVSWLELFSKYSKNIKRDDAHLSFEDCICGYCRRVHGTSVY